MPAPTFICECQRPKPRPDGAGGSVCVECHGRTGRQKKSEDQSESVILTREQLAAEVKQIRRIMHGLNNRLEKLDDALNSN